MAFKTTGFIRITGQATAGFSNGETITGGTSSATATVTRPIIIHYNSRSGSFTVGQTVTGGTSGATAVVATYSSTLGIMEFSSTTGIFQIGETYTGPSGSAVVEEMLVGVDFVSASIPIDGETITGGTSGATATIILTENKTIQMTTTPSVATEIIGLPGIQAVAGSYMIDASDFHLDLLTIGTGEITIDAHLSVRAIRANGANTTINVGELGSGFIDKPCGLVLTDREYDYEAGTTGLSLDIIKNPTSVDFAIRNSHLRLNAASNIVQRIGYFGSSPVWDLDGAVISAIKDPSHAATKMFEARTGSILNNCIIKGFNYIGFQGSPSDTTGLVIQDTSWGFHLDNVSPTTPVVLIKASSPRYHTQRRSIYELIDCKVTDWVTTRSNIDYEGRFKFFRTLKTVSIGANANATTTRYVYGSDGVLIDSSALDVNGELSQVIKWGDIKTFTLKANSDPDSATSKATPAMINSNTGTYKHLPQEYKLPLKTAHISYLGDLQIQTGITFDVSSDAYLDDYVLGPNLVNDPLITQSVKATVDAYTTLNTAQQVYDYCKSYLINNYLGEEQAIVGRSGTQVVLGSFVLTIDATAGSVLTASKVSTGYRYDRSPTNSWNFGNNSGNMNAYSTGDALIGIEFTTGSDITTPQIVWESGSNTLGIALGINTGNLEVFAGSTTTVWCSTAISASTKYYATVKVDLTNDAIQVYLSSTRAPLEADLVVTSASFAEADWSSSSDTGVGVVDGTTIATYTVAFKGTIDSDLRLWTGNDITVTYVETFETNYSALTVKSSTFTGGATAISGSVTTQNGTLLDGGEFDCNILYNSGAGTTITDIICSGTMDFGISGTYNVLDSALDDVTNSSGGIVTLQKQGTTTITTNSGPNITIIEPDGSISFSGLLAGSQVVVFEAGTTTEVFRTNSSGTSETTGNFTVGNYDYTVMKVGYFPIRVANFIVSVGTNNASVSQSIDRAYEASSGLTFGTNTSLAGISGNEFDVTTDTTVQNFYSAWKEFWIAEPTLVNKTFPITPYGPDSFSFNDGYEFTTSSIQYLSRDGFRYVNISGGFTAQYCAVLTQGVSISGQVEFQQVEQIDTAPVSSAYNVGNMDQVVKFFGDVTHGNFDYTGHLDLKVQTNGYRQAEFNVIENFGNLEERLYICNLTEIEIAGLMLGDPGISGVSITDDHASPIIWDAGDAISGSYSLTITDTNNNSGEDILRWLNYNLSLDATFQGKDPFRFPEMVLFNGSLDLNASVYETLRGELHTLSGDILVGTRVIDGSGIPHKDFTRFQTDTGIYATPPPRTTLTITNLTNSNVQVLDENGAVHDRQTNATGTYELVLPFASTGTWNYIVNREGYNYKSSSFGANEGQVTVNGVLTKKLLQDGSDMYTGSASAFLSVVPQADGSRMNLRIGDGAVSVQAIFDEVEDALMTQDGMSYLVNGGGEVSIALLTSGSFLFLEQNVRVIRDTAPDSNATINGTVISTESIVLDNTNGEVNFNTQSEADIQAGYGGFIWIDEVNGTDSNIVPFGSRASPCKTWQNVVDLNPVVNLFDVAMLSDVTLTSSAVGFNIIGKRALLTLTLNGQSIDEVKFEDMEITGTGSFGSGVIAEKCSFDTVVGFCGSAFQCRITNTLSIGVGNASFLNCYSGIAGSGRPTVTLTDASSNVDFRAYSGGLNIAGAVTGNNVSIDVVSGKVELLSSCTGGNVVLRGDLTIVNNSAMTITDDSTVSKTNTIITNQTTMNEGIKKASKVIPYNSDLT